MTDAKVWATGPDELLAELRRLLSDDDDPSLHPKLERSQVWCRRCGATGVWLWADTVEFMRRGWPMCCGETMTIDAPNEREPSDA